MKKYKVVTMLLLVATLLAGLTAVGGFGATSVMAVPGETGAGGTPMVFDNGSGGGSTAATTATKKYLTVSVTGPGKVVDGSHEIRSGSVKYQLISGDVKNLKVEADEKAELDSITLDGSDITSLLDSSGNYTYTMGTRSQTLKITFVDSDNPGTSESTSSSQTTTESGGSGQVAKTMDASMPIIFIIGGLLSLLLCLTLIKKRD